ncbi:hypothetical protein LXL04_012255 [Taraxacum kok-saghyz]
MELYLSSSTIATAIISSIALLAFLHHIFFKKKATRNPPQAKGAWPIIGHLHLLGGPELPHKVLGDMAEEHGPIFTVKLGVHEALVVSDGAIAKECFTTNDKVFASRPKAEAAKIMGYDYALFGLAPYGDYWRQIRKMVTLEVLSQRRVDMIAPIRASELRASIKDLYDVWVTNKMSENAEMVSVDMGQWFGKLVVNIMLMGAFVASDFIPYLRFFDVGGYKKDMETTARDLDNIFDVWLKEHKTDSRHEDDQDFIYVLMSILQGASEDEFPGFDHDTIIKSTCQQLLVAGVDTTSLTLTWDLALLLNNPKALQIAQDEIDEHVGKDRLVEESDMKNLVYLDAIIKETFRLYPAGPLSVPHESLEECIVAGYNIPKCTRLLVNLYKMQRDSNVWSEPHEFRPERFLTSHKGLDVKGNHYELLPFGSGRRMCPGISFALQELSLTLASLIQQFVLKKPSNEPVDMTESMGLTIDKATPLDVLLAPRLSSNMYHVSA